MKKTRRFVALLLAAVLALALFTACGAAEQPQQSAIGKVYEDWFVEKLNSKLPEGKTVQKVDVKHSEMMAALEKIGKDGKFTSKEGWYRDAGGKERESHYWLIISNPVAWSDTSGTVVVDAVPLTPENLTKYGPGYFISAEQQYRIDEYYIATRVMDGNTYVAVYVHLEDAHS